MKARSLLCFTATLVAATAQAQSGGQFEITRHTIDGGGDTVSGGTFELTGTVGQPESGAAQNDRFVVVSGFWQPAAKDGGDIFDDDFEE